MGGGLSGWGVKWVGGGQKEDLCQLGMKPRAIRDLNPATAWLRCTASKLLKDTGTALGFEPIIVHIPHQRH